MSHDYLSDPMEETLFCPERSIPSTLERPPESATRSASGFCAGGLIVTLRKTAAG